MVGGTRATVDEDMKMATTMFKIWAKWVDLDWGSPEYESIRRNKLSRLLYGYQQQPCARFWVFLKRMRLAQRTPSRGLELIRDTTLLGNLKYAGPEDMFAFGQFYPLEIQKFILTQ